MSGPARPARGSGIGRLVGVAVAVFVLTFSLVPLYRIACEKVFGIRLERGPASTAQAAPAAGRRTVRVEFDGGVNSRLPWSFHPARQSMDVVPGELNQTEYYARNEGPDAVVGSAVPSVAPARASGYFNKTECFCFTAQTLEPGERRPLPVRFIVDPNLPADVHVLTLSYTFYRNDALTAELPGAMPAGAAHASPRANP